MTVYQNPVSDTDTDDTAGAKQDRTVNRFADVVHRITQRLHTIEDDPTQVTVNDVLTRYPYVERFFWLSGLRGPLPWRILSTALKILMWFAGFFMFPSTLTGRTERVEEDKTIQLMALFGGAVPVLVWANSGHFFDRESSFMKMLATNDDTTAAEIEQNARRAFICAMPISIMFWPVGYIRVAAQLAAGLVPQGVFLGLFYGIYVPLGYWLSVVGAVVWMHANMKSLASRYLQTSKTLILTKTGHEGTEMIMGLRTRCDNSSRESTAFVACYMFSIVFFSLFLGLSASSGLVTSSGQMALIVFMFVANTGAVSMFYVLTLPNVASEEMTGDISKSLSAEAEDTNSDGIVSPEETMQMQMKFMYITQAVIAQKIMGGFSYKMGSLVITRALAQQFATTSYSAGLYFTQLTSEHSSLILKTIAQIQQAVALTDMKVDFLMDTANTTEIFSAHNCTFTMPVEAGVCRLDFPEGMFFDYYSTSVIDSDMIQ